VEVEKLLFGKQSVCATKPLIYQPRASLDSLTTQNLARILQARGSLGAQKIETPSSEKAIAQVINKLRLELQATSNPEEIALRTQLEKTLVCTMQGEDRPAFGVSLAGGGTKGEFRIEIWRRMSDAFADPRM
jgi:hypothetical protein